LFSGVVVVSRLAFVSLCFLALLGFIRALYFTTFMAFFGGIFWLLFDHFLVGILWPSFGFSFHYFSVLFWRNFSTLLGLLWQLFGCLFWQLWPSLCFACGPHANACLINGGSITVAAPVHSSPDAWIIT
jgi:hypothetical protein